MKSDTQKSYNSVPVLIVGAGLVGLSASLFLAHYGVASLLVERHSGTSTHPKQFGLSVRAMELLRSVGIEDAVHSAGARLAENTDFVIVPTLAQSEISRHPIGNVSAEDIRPFSPTSIGICPQDVLEPLLLEAAQKLGSEVCFGTELLSFEQDANGVTATLLERATGTRRVVHADYLIAADGTSSQCRRVLDIAITDNWSSQHNISIYFSADLSVCIGGKQFAFCLITHPEATGILIPTNNEDCWIFMVQYAPELGETPEQFTDERCLSLLRTATSSPELEVELKSVLPWEAAARVAQRFSERRVFLAGDAVHQMPPTGGFGASTGIQDAHNLAWKLALVLKKQAGPVLLSTYESERRPVAQFTTEQARLRWQAGALRHSADAAQREKLALAHDLVVMLGYQYASQAVIAPRQALPSLEHVERDLDGYPGTRAPHLWIEYQGKRISTLDLYGKHMVFFVGEEAHSWRNAARAISHRLGLDLTVYTVGPGGDIDDGDGLWYTTYGITRQGAILIRPDGFVGWRAENADEYAEQTLERVLSTLLCRAAS